MLSHLSSLIFILALSMLFVSPSLASPEQRVALVIGNAGYATITPLRNPPNDANAVAELLREMGYEVILSLDASHADLERLAQEFRVKLSNADVGLFYYSGHGFQTNRVGQQHPVNHIVPVDFDVHDEDPIRRTLGLDNVLNALKDNVRVGLVLMDACRNDPQLTAASGRAVTGSKAITISRGFSPVNIPAAPPRHSREEIIKRPTGLLIAYATDPGNVASEGEEGGLSPFTGALVKHMRSSGLSLAELMGRVSADVAITTQGQQTPWNVASLTAGTYVFFPDRPTISKATQSTRSPASPSRKRSSGARRATNLPPNIGAGAGAGF